MKCLTMVMVTVFLFGAVAEARGTARGLVDVPLRDEKDLATRIRTDPQVAEDVADAYRQRLGITFATNEETARHVETLEVCGARAGTYGSSRRLRNGSVGLHDRFVAEGTPSLCNPNTDGDAEVLLRCGNVVEKKSEPKRQMTVVQRHSPPPVSWLNPASVNFGRAFENCPDESVCGQWHRTGRAVIYGAAGVGAAALLPTTRVRNSYSSSNSSNNDVNVENRGNPQPPAPPPSGGPINPAPVPPSGDEGGPRNPAP